MSQISPPLRILLVGSIVFLAAWFAFLRPGGDTESVTPEPGNVATGAPAESAPGQAAQTAQSAADTASAAAAASAGETVPGTTAAAPAASAQAGAADQATGSVESAKLPKAVRKAVDADKVLVLYFWNSKAADDRQVRRELRGINRYNDDVKVHVADVRRISRYAPITRGVNVEQSPSIVVVDRDLEGTLLEGYVDRVTINQAVRDAVGGIVSKPVNAYFKSIDKLCAQAETEIKALGRPNSPAQLAQYMTAATAVSASYDAKFAAMDTPAKHRAFAKKFAAYNAQGTAALQGFAAEAKSVRDVASAQAFQQRYETKANAMQAQGREQFGKYGIATCLS
jgi:hypothetical protein